MDIRHDGVHIKGPKGATLRVGVDGDINLDFAGGATGFAWVSPDGLQDFIIRLTPGQEALPDTNKPTVRDLLVHAIDIIDGDADTVMEPDTDDTRTEPHPEEDFPEPEPEPEHGPFAKVDGDYALHSDPDHAQAIAERVREEVMGEGMTGPNMRRMQRYVEHAESFLEEYETPGRKSLNPFRNLRSRPMQSGPQNKPPRGRILFGLGSLSIIALSAIWAATLIENDVALGALIGVGSTATAGIAGLLPKLLDSE